MNTSYNTITKYTFFLYFIFSTFSGYGVDIIRHVGTSGKIIMLLFALTLILIQFQKLLSLYTNLHAYKLIFIFICIILYSGLNNLITTNQNQYLFLNIYMIITLLFILMIALQNIDFTNLIFTLKSYVFIQFLIGIPLILLFNIDIYDLSVGGAGETSGGLSGFLEKRNTFALLSSLGFFTSFYALTKRKTIFDFLLLITYLILIYYSQTRFVFIIIITFIFFYIYFSYLNKIKNFNIKFLIYLIQLTLIVSFLLVIYKLFLTESNSINDFTTGRLFVWGLFFKECFDNTWNLLLGYGNSYISDLILHKYSKYNYYLSILDSLSLHSSYLKAIEVSGLIGLFLFLGLNYIAFKNSNLYSKSIILSFLIGGLVESFLMNPNTVGSLFYWLILFMNLKRTKYES